MTSARILLGDCRDVLRSLPAESVNCVVTSPPYWGLRDYGVAGQIGLEQSIAEWVGEMVAVFREVRRVLRPDGTCWVNLGDSYAGGGRGGNPTEDTSTLQGGHANQRASMVKRVSDKSTLRGNGHVGGGAKLRAQEAPRAASLQGSLKPKDLVGQPWRVAFALQDDGWYLRSEIIWHKANPMPESIKDRPTKAHEQIFLLSKSERYFYDQAAIAERVSADTHARYAAAKGEAFGMPNWAKGEGPHDAVTHSRRDVGVGTRARPRKGAPNGSGTKNNASFDAAMLVMPDVRNARTVWTFPTEGFPEAHFATFPRELPKRCILAGCPLGGVVLDPFNGSGTTGEVALSLGRSYIGVELNPEYVAMTERRLSRVTLGLPFEAAA